MPVFPSRCHWLAAALILVAQPVAVRAETVAPYQPPTPSSTVEVLNLRWRDAARNRDVPAKIYYPKEAHGLCPVILFSHGLGGSCEGYSYLGKHWAGCGYVSVHITHLGSDDSLWKNVPVAERGEALKKGAMNLQNALNRPADCQFALDQIEALNKDSASPLHDRLDRKAMAVAGHSFGGYTTLALAGQTFMLPLGRSKRYDEPRLKAAIQMSAPAPTIRRDLDDTYGSITLPVMHMTGTKDFLELLPQTTAADRRIPFDHMGHSETCLVTFNGGDHFIFSGRERKGAAAEQAAQDEAFQKMICVGTTAFWDAYLRNNVAAKEWLLKGGYAKLLGSLAVFETKEPKEK